MPADNKGRKDTPTVKALCGENSRFVCPLSWDRSPDYMEEEKAGIKMISMRRMSDRKNKSVELLKTALKLLLLSTTPERNGVGKQVGLNLCH